MARRKASAASAAGQDRRPKRRRTRKGRTAAAAMSSASSSSSSSSDSDSSSSESESSEDDGDEKGMQKPAAISKAPDVSMSKAERMRRAQQMQVDSSSDEESSSSASSSSSSPSSSSSESDSETTPTGKRTRKSRTAAVKPKAPQSAPTEQEVDEDEDEDDEADLGRQRRAQYTPPPPPLSSFDELPPPKTRAGATKGPAQSLEEALRDLRPPRIPPPRGMLSELAERSKVLHEKRRANLERRRRNEQLSAGEPLTERDYLAREDDFSATWMRLMVDEFGEELDALRKKDPSLSSGDGNAGAGRMPLLIDALQAGTELYSRGHEGTAIAARLSAESKTAKGTPHAARLPASMHDVDEVAVILGAGKAARGSGVEE